MRGIEGEREGKMEKGRRKGEQEVLENLLWDLFYGNYWGNREDAIGRSINSFCGRKSGKQDGEGGVE